MADTTETRRTNLLKLAAGSRNKSEFARLAGLAPSQLRQIVNVDATGAAVRDCGEKLARKIEGALGLGSGWLDTEHLEDLDAHLVARLAGLPRSVAEATLPSEPEQVRTDDLTPMQRAVVDALLKVCRNGELSDRECIDLLDAWKEKLT